MSQKRFFNQMPCLLSVLLVAAATHATEIDRDKIDAVVVRTDEDDGTRRIRGKIIRWEGSALTLASGSRERQIDNNRIVDIESSWSEVAIQARQQLLANSFSRAVVLLRQAIEEEQRPWARSMLRADLIRALLVTEQTALACDQFLILLRDDPNTRFLTIAPLAWTDQANDASMIRRASDWITSDVATIRLLAASHLIGTAQQEAALQVLEPLSDDIDQRIATLASTQIWRAQRDVDTRLIEHWRGQLMAMPRSLRPGPWYVLAGYFESASQHNEAITTWMRLPILHEDRPDLAAAALYRVARLMHNTASTGSAHVVREELVRRFPDSVWTRRASQLK